MAFKFKISRCLFLILFLFLLTGCATFNSPKEDTIKIDSEPTGAKVFINGEEMGTTPFSRTFRRSTFENKYMVFKKDGYAVKEVTLEKQFNSSSLWNFIFITTTSGATSFGIDALSGALIEYSPRAYVVPLAKKEAEDALTSDEKVIFVVQNFESLKKNIVRGAGEHLQSLYDISGNAKISYEEFVNKLQKNSSSYLVCENGLELYRKLRQNSVL